MWGLYRCDEGEFREAQLQDGPETVTGVFFCKAAARHNFRWGIPLLAPARHLWVVWLCSLLRMLGALIMVL